MELRRIRNALGRMVTEPQALLRSRLWTLQPLRQRYRAPLKMRLHGWLRYHHTAVHKGNMRWMGVPIWQHPLDCWIYQEILHEVKPDVVVEIGSAPNDPHRRYHVAEAPGEYGRHSLRGPEDW